jgi:hypothetical protein
VIARIAIVALAISACSGVAPKTATTQKTGRYHVPAEVGTLVIDAAAFAKFAAEVRPDLERESNAKDPEIAKARLFVLAMLEGLDEKWPAALALVDRVAALEAKSEDKAMTGLTLRVWIDVHGDAEKYRVAFDSRVHALPRDKLGDQLAMLRTMGKVFTPDVCRQLVNQEVSPHVRDGTVSIDEVHAIVFQRYAVVRLVPVGAQIDEALGALGIEALSGDPQDDPQ